MKNLSVCTYVLRTMDWKGEYFQTLYKGSGSKIIKLDMISKLASLRSDENTNLNYNLHDTPLVRVLIWIFFTGVFGQENLSILPSFATLPYTLIKISLSI